MQFKSLAFRRTQHPKKLYIRAVLDDNRVDFANNRDDLRQKTAKQKDFAAKIS
jgi:hypothetical protein